MLHGSVSQRECWDDIEQVYDSYVLFSQKSVPTVAEFPPGGEKSLRKDSSGSRNYQPEKMDRSLDSSRLVNSLTLEAFVTVLKAHIGKSFSSNNQVLYLFQKRFLIKVLRISREWKVERILFLTGFYIKVLWNDIRFVINRAETLRFSEKISTFIFLLFTSQ